MISHCRKVPHGKTALNMIKPLVGRATFNHFHRRIRVRVNRKPAEKHIFYHTKCRPIPVQETNNAIQTMPSIFQALDYTTISFLFSLSSNLPEGFGR
jgi:hypothetical protein